jgi:uncharacterized protein (DUF1697 family)
VEKYVALFRGINVGGHNRLPMGELKQLLQDLGLREVETYIQSGNVVFASQAARVEALGERIREAVEEQFGFAPVVLVLRAGAFEKVVAANPYPEATSEPKTLHCYFLVAEPHDPDLDELESLKKESEQFALHGKVFYLHAPEGIGRSKLAERVEKALGVPATARNWRTVERISTMINA